MDKNTWLRALQIENECNRRGEEITRTVIQESLQIPQAEAQHIIWSLQNKHIIKLNPDVFEASSKCIICADLHIPYQDNLAVQAMIEYMLEYQPDTLIINGDLIDFYQISSFVKNPTNKGVGLEIKETRAFLENIRTLFPDIRIIYKQGNHSERLEKYIFQSAPKISDLIDDLLPVRLNFDGLRVEYKIEPFSYGKLWILHGHEKPGGAYNPEYITNVIWQYVHDNFAVGHFHRGQEKVFKNIAGATYWGCSVPYMAGAMDYAPLNKWNQGFVRVDFADNGNFRGRTIKIINGEMY